MNCLTHLHILRMSTTSANGILSRLFKTLYKHHDYLLTDFELDD